MQKYYFFLIYASICEFFTKNQLSVLTLVAVSEERQIGLVAAFGNLALYDCFLHGAAGLVSMRTVTETTVAADAEDLRKEMADFFPLKIDSAKPLNTRSVNHSAVFQKIHLAERGGMHPFVMGVRYLACSGDLASEKRIKQGRFAYSGVTGE